ncbi:hypothetical protein Cgig2_002459 [Carnegiea gigantea]|uniref:F-box domain-containing protein n=1 Tax=Carnegiea gigantea TaxID=171969 RepID=A0A9Q1KVE6_9CARY|nr:hypothetical protein Cgig2_002459 [Carnegiea gigantea]
MPVLRHHAAADLRFAPCQGSKNCKDLISLVVDDVLLFILSLLDLKEAARTSVLSKRWRHLWSILPDYYDFDVSGTWWWRGKMDRQPRKDQLCKFVDYVNQVHGNFKVVGDSLKLRYLEISFCKDLRKLEISARNLISVAFNGHNEDVKFSYVPLLNEASFRGTYPSRLIHNFRCISAFCFQLTKLTLAMNRRALLQDADVHFPLLENENRVVNYKVHSHLNTFETVGFLGAKVDTELVLHLAEFAIALEKVILYPFQPPLGGEYCTGQLVIS